MRVAKKYRELVKDALEMAAGNWQRCANAGGGCQPDNDSYERSLLAGEKAKTARTLVRELKAQGGGK